MSRADVKPEMDHIEGGHETIGGTHGDNALKILGDERVELTEEDVSVDQLKTC